MKTELLLIALLTLAGTTLFFQQDQEQTVESANLVNLFQNWQQTHAVKFTASEADYRFAVFRENYEFIQKFNAENPETVLGLTAFAAMTNEEFKAAKTTQIMDAPQFSDNDNQDLSVLSGAPSSFNWVNEGKVSPIQNQGQCGSCWAFSAVSQLEGLNAINSGNLVKFSEQQVTSCTPAPFSLGCNGGNPLFAFYYVASAGVESEQDYPYVQQTNSKTAACNYDASKTVYKNAAGSTVKANNPDAMKAQLLKQPLSVAVQASGLAFQLYTSGVIKSNCGTNLDHAISLVGYNTEDSNNQYWIVRNSWGQSWGEKGYANIAISEGNGVCGINMSVSYPTA